MLLDKNSPWGEERLKWSTGPLAMVLINSLIAGFFFILSGIYSFLETPMFGDEFESSPLSMVIRSLVIVLVIDSVAVWRFRKLNKLWLPLGRYKYLKWFYQVLFVGLIGVSNIGFLAVAWFWSSGLIR